MLFYKEKMNRPPQLYQPYNPNPSQQQSYQTPLLQQQTNQMSNKMTPPQNLSPIPNYQNTGTLNSLSSQNGGIVHSQEPFLANNVSKQMKEMQLNPQQPHGAFTQYRPPGQSLASGPSPNITPPRPLMTQQPPVPPPPTHSLPQSVAAPVLGMPQQKFKESLSTTETLNVKSNASGNQIHANMPINQSSQAFITTTTTMTNITNGPTMIVPPIGQPPQPVHNNSIGFPPSVSQPMNFSKNVGPPMTGQHISGNIPPTSLPPPMGHQPTIPYGTGQKMPSTMGQQIGMPPTINQRPVQNVGMPPLPGQQRGIAPMTGQPMGIPPFTGQQSGMQPLSGQTMGMSPIPNQQMGMPPMVGQHMPMPQSVGQPQVNRQPSGINSPMSAPVGASQQAKRIDPNQMPNPIQVMKDDQAAFNEEVFLTSTRGKVPPLVSTKCRIQDDGNCSPRYMRSSIYSMPCNQDMVKTSGIPIAIVTTPLAKIPDDENQIRYVLHGAGGPVRCNRCKAYMNPFMQFIDGGRRFICNICNHSSEVPQDYFCHLDHQGRRVDMFERPELCFGSYEFIATVDYCKSGKLPSPPAFIFMIDVSYQSIQQGMVKILSEELRSRLENLPKDVGMEESVIKVGFMTYSTQLHFYNVKGNLPQPQMMVVTDVEDAFVPLQDGFLVNYNEAKDVINSFLDMLPEMFREARETEVILGPVIKCGVEALKSAGISGKLYIFHSSLPIAEAPGKLKNREDRKLLATDKEKTILMPQGNFYMNLVKDCIDAGVSIDLFLFPNSYVDVATIGLMVTQTGGQVYRYSFFKEVTHGKQFSSDLKKNFERTVGFDAVMRLRCSTGLRPVEFFGSFVMNNTTDVELASIDSEKAIAIEIKHDDKIPEDGVAYIQNALLYTSVSGQRRLRIHNMAFSTCSQLPDLYRCCELDTIVNYLSKFALRQVLTSTPQAIKDSLVQKCVQILACYRQHCATPSTSGQLILPECMKLLPLYVNCLIKSDVLAGGSEMSSDDRAFLMQACLSMGPASSASYFYPRVFALHSLDLDHDDDIIPEQIRCLGEKFQENGVYLLENTISMFIWIGLQVNPHVLQDIFNVKSIGQLDVDMTQLPELDTPLSKRVRQIVEAIQSERQRFLKLTVVRQRDKLEPWFKHYIVEDTGFNTSHLSYVDFLCHVHKEIRNILS